MDVLGGFLLYLGLIALFAGLLSLIKPLRFAGIRSRKRALAVVAAGAALFVAGIALPIDHTYVTGPVRRIDGLMPHYQFREVHSIRIAATPERVYAALRATPPREIRFYRTLTWIRRFGRSSPPGVLNASEQRPILDTFTSGGFTPLTDDPPRELILTRVGTGRGPVELPASKFAAYQADRMVKILLNFEVRKVDEGTCLLTTETRVLAVGSNVERGFATYWRMIYPGSALIRRTWLQAIRARAER